MGRRLLLDEVNAAIDGAADGGATEFLVNDAHWTMQNMPPGELHGEASYLSGKHKPLYMMEGLEGGFDAVFMVSYHGSIGHERAILAHTYNPERDLGGQAQRDRDRRGGPERAGRPAPRRPGRADHRRPGDRRRGRAVHARASSAVVVKRSVSRFAAESLHPAKACELIRAGARAAVERLGEPEASGDRAPGRRSR